MKVIKESEEVGLLKIKDDLFTYDSPLGAIFNEFNRLSRMEDDLFTREVEIPRLSFIPCGGSFEAKSIYEGSWGDATQGVVNFYAWLKRCFINHHKLDYELMIRLEEYWNVDEAIHDERELNDDHDIGNLDNDLVRDNAPYHTNEKEELYEEGRCELLRNPCQEPPVCKIKRFEVIKYSFM
ncbi:hypothetical protein Tco_0290590 [Tanacetum coccineum]